MKKDTHWMANNFEEPSEVELACDKLLASLRTTLDKLVMLSSQRATDSDEYRNAELGSLFSPDVVSRVLKSRHERIFREWLAHSMEEQYKDLTEFLAANPRENSSAVVENPPMLIPSAASDPERTLFLNDFTFVLGLIDRD